MEQSKKEINAPVYISSTNPQNHIPILVQQYPDLFGGTFFKGQNYVQKVFYKSNGLKAGYTFEDVAKEIEDAKRLNISIPVWRIVEKRKEDEKVGIKLNLNVKLKAEYRNFTTNVTLVKEDDGGG